MGPPEPLEESESRLDSEPGGTAPCQRREDDPAALAAFPLKSEASTLLRGKAKSPSNALKSEGVDLSAEISALRPPAEDDGVHAAWRALRELWAVRPWPVTPREMAIGWALFVKIVADGTPLDAVLAGAGAWVRGVDDPRYLMALPQWLAAKGWEYAPPPKRMRQARASGQRHGYQRRQKTDLASLMHQLGQAM
jgi:hypothetical protein